MKHLLIISLAAAALLARAEPTNNVLSDCVIQEVVPGKHMTVAFFTLHHSGMAQSIVAAAIPSLTDTVELHRMTRKNGIMEMEAIQDYSLKDGETLFFHGSYHLMLMKIEHLPAIGSTHRITLVFDDDSTASCDATVRTMAEVFENVKKKPEDKHFHRSR